MGLVAPELLRLAEAGSANGEECLFTYIDWGTGKGNPVFVPLRFGFLRAISEVGSIIVAQIEVADFWTPGAPDPAASFSHLDTRLVWHAPSLYRRNPLHASENAHLTAFESRVSALILHKAFASEPVFYHVVGFRNDTSDALVTAESGDFTLSARTDYQLTIYHFRPDERFTAILEVAWPAPQVSAISSPVLYLDSNYDLKTVQLRVSNPPPPRAEIPSFDSNEAPVQQLPSVTLSFYKSADITAPKSWEFDLRLRIRPDYSQTITFGLITGFFLAIPAAIGILANKDMGDEVKSLFILITVAGYLLFGVFAAFGLQKPSQS